MRVGKVRVWGRYLAFWGGTGALLLSRLSSPDRPPVLFDFDLGTKSYTISSWKESATRAKTSVRFSAAVLLQVSKTEIIPHVRGDNKNKQGRRLTHISHLVILSDGRKTTTTKIQYEMFATSAWSNIPTI